MNDDVATGGGDWVFSQCFGEKIPVSELNDHDVISAVEFDPSGSFLATGDRGGRVVLFELDGHNAVRSIADGVSRRRPALKRPVEFRFQSEFQSHEQEFDYLKSLEIEEKINQIRWCRPSNGALLLLSTNDKTVKLWKVHERVAATVSSFNVAAASSGSGDQRSFWAPLHSPGTAAAAAAATRSVTDRIIYGSALHAPASPPRDALGDVTMRDAAPRNAWHEEEPGKEDDNDGLHGGSSSHSTSASSITSTAGSNGKGISSSSSPAAMVAAATPSLRLPRLERGDRTFVSSARRVFANAHAYHINSVSVNSDGETFLSADDLRINLWNLSISDQAYTVVDVKPSNMEELAEVITAAEFHPSHCHLLMYSSSRGSIRLGDMRARALCDAHAKVFEEPEPPGSKSFYSEIIASVSDVKFSRDGRYVVSRDFLTVKIWDLKMERSPVKTINVHEHLRPRLAELYENESIFDKFEVAVSGDGNNLATGSYDNTFQVYDRYGKLDLSVEASKMPPKQQARLRQQRRRQQKQQQGGSNADSDVDIDLGDDEEELQEDDDGDDARGLGSPASAAAGRSPLAPRGGASAARDRRRGGGSLGRRQPVDYSRKAMHLSWHPQQPVVAVAGLNNLYIYSQ